MANFCGKCGSPLNQGLCPNCDKASFAQAPASFIPVQTNIAQNDDIKTMIADEEILSEVKEETVDAVVIPEPEAVPEEPVVPVAPVIPEQEVAAPEPVVQSVQTPVPQYSQPQYQAPAPQYSQPQYQAPAPQYSQPQYQQAAPVQKPQKPKKDKKPRKQMNKALSCVLIVFLCILTFATTLYASLAFTLRSATTEDSVNDIVSGADVVEILEDLPISESAKQTSDADNFAELICEYIQYNFYRDSIDADGMVVTTKNLETFIEESDGVEFFSELILDYVYDFYNDDDVFELSAEVVEEFLKDNEYALQKAFDVSSYDLYRTDTIVEEHYYTPDTYTYVEVDVLKDFSKWLINDEDVKTITPSEIKDEEPLAFDAVHYGLSYTMIIIAVVVTVVFAVLMFIFNWKQALYGLGITFLLLGGALTTVGMIAADVIVPEFTSLNIASYIAGSVISCGLPVFLAILGAGILLLAGGIVVTILAKGKKKAQ